jgi:ABC-2 type transport system ATP-binding protein
LAANEGSEVTSVEVEDLSKVYKVPVREAGLTQSIRALFRREFREVHAVDAIGFSLEPGEVVGFLGPNGAGKTTTLKMLSGLLFPDEGRARVLGHVPQRRERSFLSRIALVMGNRNSLQWDLPADDSFELEQAIYQIPADDFRSRRDEFVELLDAGDLVTKPVRNLSLGERMKVEIIAALLHGPEVLFLDEPTIGLDVTMQKRIRRFIADYARRYTATVLLTSHYMADVVALCKRVIVIHHGRILYDGDLAGLSQRFSAHTTITLSVTGRLPDLSRYGEVVETDLGKAVLRVPRAEASAVTAGLLAELPVSDLTIEDPPIEDVIEQAFAIEAPEHTQTREKT